MARPKFHVQHFVVRASVSLGKDSLDRILRELLKACAINTAFRQAPNHRLLLKYSGCSFDCSARIMLKDLVAFP